MLKFVKSVKKRFSRGMDIMSHFHVEIDQCNGGVTMALGGVTSVLELGDDIARLRTGFAIMEIRGDALSVSVYENKTVEISGKVKTVEFINAEN